MRMLQCETTTHLVLQVAAIREDATHRKNLKGGRRGVSTRRIR